MDCRVVFGRDCDSFTRDGNRDEFEDGIAEVYQRVVASFVLEGDVEVMKEDIDMSTKQDWFKSDILDDSLQRGHSRVRSQSYIEITVVVTLPLLQNNLNLIAVHYFNRLDLNIGITQSHIIDLHIHW